MLDVRLFLRIFEKRERGGSTSCRRRDGANDVSPDAAALRGPTPIADSAGNEFCN